MNIARYLPAMAACILAIVTIASCGGGGSAGGGSGGGTGTSPPVIVSFSPTTGSVGDQVSILGVNFDASTTGNTVRFNGVTSTVLSATTTSLVVTVPAGASTGKIQVSTVGGTTVSSADFTVLSGTTPGSQWQTRTYGPVSSALGLYGLAHNGTRFVGVGSGSSQVSTDGRFWTAAQGASNTNDVAWNGQLFVAVGGSYWVYTSADGLTWIARTLCSSSCQNLSAVAGTASMWVAVGTSGVIYSSPDGVVWTARSSGTTKNLVDVAWAANRFVAVGTDGAVVTSPDGIAWTLQAAPTADSFTAVGGSSSLIVAATYPYSGSQLMIMTSPDGVTWTPRAPNLSVFNDIIYAGGRYLAVGDYGAATSPDGITWTGSATLPGLFNAVAYMNSQYWAVGHDGSWAPIVFTSSNGLDWTIVQNAHALTALARSPSDGRIVAVGTSHIARTSTDNGATWSFAPLGTIVSNYPFLDLVWSNSANGFIGHVQVAANEYAYKSTNGAIWTSLGNMNCQGGIAASPTLMVNVGTSLVGACMATSTDGATWTSVTPPSSLYPKGVFWTGSQFVAVGNSGLIATSPDGTNWTVRTSGVTSSLYNGAANGSTIVVVGSSGTVLSSSDNGVTWTPRSSGTTSTLRRARLAGSDFYVTGTAGTLLRSSDGTSWTKLQLPYTTDLGDILWLSNVSRLVLTGSNGLTATSP